MESFVDILSALLTPVIAVVAAYIAWQQYQVNRHRLRHELYERRLRVYKTVQGFLSEIFRTGKTDCEQCAQFYADASEAFFLFDESVHEYIEKIYYEGCDLAYHHEQLYPSDGLDGLPVGEERSAVAKEKTKNLKWLNNQLSESRILFRNHIGVPS